MQGPSFAEEAPRSARTSVRRNYDDEAYGRRIERPIAMYREGHSRDYEPISGSKRPYAAIVCIFLFLFIYILILFMYKTRSFYALLLYITG